MTVEIKNTSKALVADTKKAQKTYSRYSGYPGGLRVMKGTETAEKKGLKELVRLATYQMLPGNKIRREMMKHLTIED